MIKSFKADISARFLEKMEDSTIGKAVTRITGLSAFKMLSEFGLNLPTMSNPTGWSADCLSVINFDSLQIDYVIIFLKFAWLNSENEKSEYIDNLIQLVSRELTQFEKDLIIEDVHKKLTQTDELLKNQKLQIVQKDEDLQTTKKVLNESNKKLQVQKFLIYQKEKNLKSTNQELEIKLQKERKISLNNSVSASRSRACPEVTILLTKLVESYPKRHTKELWSLISDERDGSDLYRENDKIHHEGCDCREFGLKAFYPRITNIRKKVEKKF